MFGHQDNQDEHHDEQPAGVPAVNPVQPPAEPPGGDGNDPAAAPAVQSDAGTAVSPEVVTAAAPADTADPSAEDGQQPDEPPSPDGPPADTQTGVQTDTQAGAQADPSDQDQGAGWQHPGTPLGTAPDRISDVISPAGGFPKRPTYQYPNGPDPKPAAADPSGDDPANRDLLTVKKEALDDLAPLLGRLDLAPEEKFHLLMTIIQNNDDKALVKAAYEAAHAIEDEATRARALYAIVNEVDYFTQPNHEQDADTGNEAL